MLKCSQTKMFLAGNIPTKDQVQFGDFRSCLGIFNKFTNLQNKNKTGKIGKPYLAPTNRPTCRPSPAAAPASCLARPGRQAGARRRAPHGCHAPGRRLAAPLTESRRGSLPLSPPNPSDISSPPQLLPLALPSHGRRHRRRSIAVAVLPAAHASSRRVQELKQGSPDALYASSRRSPEPHLQEPSLVATPPR